MARMRVVDRRVAHELDAHHLGDDLAGDVVLRGPEAAAHDHRVAAVERDAAWPSTMRPRLSPTFVWKWESMPAERELLADPRRVGVDDLAEQQLGADRDDLTAHGVLLEPPVVVGAAAGEQVLRRR